MAKKGIKNPFVFVDLVQFMPHWAEHASAESRARDCDGETAASSQAQGQKARRTLSITQWVTDRV